MKPILKCIIIFFCIDLSADVLVNDFLKKINVSYPYFSDKYQPPIPNSILGKEVNELHLKDSLFKLFDDLEGGYKIYHSLHLDIVRKSSLAEETFKDIIRNLSNGHDIMLKNIFVPACGRFYEYKHINDLFSPDHIKASDIDQNALDFSGALFSEASNLKLVYEDLTLPQNAKNKVDGLFFLHPHITDYELLEKNPYYQKYPSEISIPYDILMSQSKSIYLSQAWKKILNNSFDQLKKGGYAFFFFYEHRELDILLDWLSDKHHFIEIGRVKNSKIIDFSFAAQYLFAIENGYKEGAEYTTMGAYRAALLIKKKL